MDPPTVSVVLPVYNGSAYLRESIESVRAQTLEDWELIVVDDCSTDDSAVVADACAGEDARIRVVRHEENRKLPAALNTGFRQAGGEFFTWTSCDNRYRPRALERMRDALRSTPEAGLVYARQAFMNEEGTELDIAPLHPPANLAVGNPVRACFLYRRIVDETIGGYDENYFLAEDYDFWLRASIHFGFATLDEVLYDYRVHGESLSTLSEGRNHELAAVVLERALPKMTWLGHRHRAMAHARLMRARAFAGDPGGAWRHLRNALLASPTTLFFGRYFRLPVLKAMLRPPRSKP